MPGKHARLSASGAKRWMSCPPSVRLEEQFPDKGSEYAAEGTFAHSLAELFLRYNNNEISKKAFTTRFNKMKTDPFYNEEMQQHIEDYTGFIWETFSRIKRDCPDAMMLFEQRLDFSEYVPEGFGTGDVVIIADDTVEVIDLKYGKGVGVSAEENPQLRLYGIGAYLEHSMLYDIQKIRMTIVQPRLENISTEELTADELLAWGENEVKPRATLAVAGEGDFCVGDHCQFCKAKKTCRARAEKNLELARFEFTSPELLTDEEIGEILKKAENLVSWAKDVSDYAYEEALKGKHFDGWKLVEGRSNRKYTDEAAIKECLLKEGYPEEEIMKPQELKGISVMEALLGKKKFASLLSGFVMKPEGKPVLVKESDKRPELSSIASAQNDFN